MSKNLIKRHIRNRPVFRATRVLRCLAALAFFSGVVFGDPIFRVATYNVENYLDAPTATRHAKSAAAAAKVAESIVALKPDVLALEEMGSTNVLLALQARLKSAGINLPYWHEVMAYDTNIHIAVLSRFPLAVRHEHTNESFILEGRNFPVRRGFAELDVDVKTNWNFTLLAAHLKSKVPSTAADEEEWRYQEATILRHIIARRLAEDPGAALIVLGDFNDLIDSKPVRLIVGRGATALFDTRPAEPRLDAADKRPVAWTQYYAKEDLYSRIDYILISRALKNCWRPDESCVLNLPGWNLGSDHRPIVAAFTAPGP